MEANPQEEITKIPQIQPNQGPTTTNQPMPYTNQVQQQNIYISQSLHPTVQQQNPL